MAEKDLSLPLLLTVAAYLVLQAGLRIWMGGTLEVDEAEMPLMAQGWHLGYGPQLPLYNWLQVAAFALFGVTTAALALLKALVLWVAVAGAWFGMRRVLPQRAALAATLSLAFLPNVIWEFQRASTHSIALLAATMLTLWAWFAVAERGSLRHWALLGLVLGLGGLSKANYWFVPALLIAATFMDRDAPNPLRGGGWRGAAMAVAIAALIVAWPYAWALSHRGQSLASLDKFYDMGGRPDRLPGLAQLLGGAVAGLLLPGLIFAGGRWATGPLGPMPWPSRVLIRAGLAGLVLALALVAIFGVTRVQARWLVPAMVLLTLGGFGWLGQRLGTRGLRWLIGAALACAVLTVAGMVQLRLGPGTTARVDFAPLVAKVDALAPDRIEGSFFLAGNLRMLRPGPAYGLPGTADPGQPPDRLLLLDSQPAPPGYRVGDSGTLALSYAGSAKTYPLRWTLYLR